MADWRGCLLTEVAAGVVLVFLGGGVADDGLLGFEGFEVQA